MLFLSSANIRFDMCLVHQNDKILRKYSQKLKSAIQKYIQNAVVVNFTDIIRTMHSALNTKSGQPVVILTFI